MNNLAKGQMVNLEIEVKPGTCIALNVPLAVEATTAQVLADLMMLLRLTKRKYSI